MTQRPVLYLGDTALSGAACYLAGLMTHYGWGYDYVPSDRGVDTSQLGQGRRLFVLSDFPSHRMADETQRALVDQVTKGAGLVMIGGWESFCGSGGGWAHTPVAGALPVEISPTDDRVNCDQPALIVKCQDHAIVEGLPWAGRPPTIGGFNRIGPGPGGQVILEARRFTAVCRGESVEFEPLSRHPLLVVGHCGRGRTAALATDVAPHWVGGLIDWGDGRVTAAAPGSGPIEVGCAYARFMGQLLGWTGRLGP